jgi:hypothetical protein
MEMSRTLSDPSSHVRKGRWGERSVAYWRSLLQSFSIPDAARVESARRRDWTPSLRRTETWVRADATSHTPPFRFISDDFVAEVDAGERGGSSFQSDQRMLLPKEGPTLVV